MNGTLGRLASPSDEQMFETISDKITFLGVILIWLLCPFWLLAGLNWGRLISYRLSESHLEIRYLGFRTRRIAFSDITGIDRFELGEGFFRCLGLYLRAAAMPWATGGFLSTESWLSRLCGTVV